jgi:hypothetical protein
MNARVAALVVTGFAGILYAIDPAFFFKDDFQLQFLPASREVARAWLSGHVPIHSPHSWMAASLVGEYQYGVFSILRALLDVIVWLLPIPLSARAAVLYLVHVAVCAAGAFRLGRSYELAPPLALLVALIASLNGWLLWWGTTWFVAIAAFAWLPWYWLALRRRRWGGAALALYLLISAGSPYVAAMAVAVLLLHLSWRALGASLLGVGLAAPALFALVEHMGVTERGALVGNLEQQWVVPLGALFGFVLPSFSVSWPVFVGWLPHPAVELLGAFVPLAALAAALRRDFARRYAKELLLLFVVLMLVLLPSRSPFRWSFHWLPLLHLSAAIAGACALQHAKRAWLWGIGLVAVTMAAAFAFDHELRATLILGGALLVLCLLWSRERNWMPAIITAALILGTFLTMRTRSEVPHWNYPESLLEAAPFDPQRRYLAVYDYDAIVQPDARERNTRGINIELRPGNVPMLAGVEFINGYTPMAHAKLKAIFDPNGHGPIPRERAEQLLRDDALLRAMGINGLVVPQELAPKGWTPAGRIAHCVILHREGEGNALREEVFYRPRSLVAGAIVAALSLVVLGVVFAKT